MSARAALTILCLLSCFNIFGQIVPPEKKKFNIGIYDGIGGVNFSPIPAADIHAFNTTLRLAPGNDYWAIGIYQEILPLSKVFYNWKWIVSTGYGSRKEEGLFYGGGPTVISKGNSLILLTGLKAFIGSRFYSQFQLGYINTHYKTENFPDKRENGVYFEFGLGVNIFKSFKKKAD